jgi:tRNA pseudouridine38-40 synthase
LYKGKVRYFLNISYTGTGYHGWQTQKNANNTVQAVCNKAISRVLQHPVSLMGCGRTDTGVHAAEFFAHFDTEEKSLVKDKKKWLYKFNSVLPFDIAVNDILAVKDEANARFDATCRTYKYIITTRKDPFLLGYSLHFPHAVDIEKMNEAGRKLEHFKEFSSFKKSHTQNKTDQCTIKQAVWKKEGQKLVFTIMADRFLRNMVRAIAGTMLNVGTGKCTVEEFCRIIESKNRSRAGASVLACGLYLTRVEYPKDIFL